MLQRSQGRAAAKLLPVLAMLMIACSAGSASAAVVSNSCGAWGSRNTAYTANTAYPDTAAIYWTTGFNYVRGLRASSAGTT